MKIDSLKQYVSVRQSLAAEKTKLEARLRAINHVLDGALKAGTFKPAKKKKFSAAARARIAAAQRARWAKIKAAKK